MKSKIAYIDDSRENLECFSLVFSKEFPVQTFEDPEKFLASFSTESYASILVDVNMPQISGFELYERIVEHANYNGCPILFISTDVSDSIKLRSFELGAVDFLDRSISPDEMIARVRSKILFFEKHRNLVEFDDLKINLTLLKTFVNNLEVPLTFIELKILTLVLKNYPDIVPKEILAEKVWNTRSSMDSSIYTHLSNLNGKLRDWKYDIQSVKGRGINLVKKAET